MKNLAIMVTKKGNIKRVAFFVIFKESFITLSNPCLLY